MWSAVGRRIVLQQQRGFNRFTRCWLSSSYPPHTLVGLPSLSPTMESGSIASWNLKPGDAFAAGDVYCSVETDKATMDFEAQDDGILAKILVEANSGDINVGDPIMITVEEEEHVAAFENYVVEGGGSSSAAPAQQDEANEAETQPAKKEEPVAAAKPTAAPTSAPSSGGPVIASPLARMLAQEKGLDICQITGTGPGGRIIAADVHEYQPGSAPSTTTTTTTAAPAAPSSGTMDWAAHSKQNVPHYYLTVDINIDALQALRQGALSEISIHSCLIKAACLSMKTVPAVNAAYLGDTTRFYENVDVQVVGDSNIIVPNGSALGLAAIESIVTDDSKADDSAVGTFSFCNLGMYGVSSCAPIIREPQACALAVGALETVIVPSNDKDVPYKTVTQLTATLSCDHRVVDGAVGAQWLATFKNYVENPTTLLL